VVNKIIIIITIIVIFAGGNTASDVALMKQKINFFSSTLIPHKNLVAYMADSEDNNGQGLYEKRNYLNKFVFNLIITFLFQYFRFHYFLRFPVFKKVKLV